MAEPGTRLRPDDRDALRAALRTAHLAHDLPVVFGGEVRDGVIRLTELFGTRTNGLRGLAVRSGAGLGGHVLAEGRPAGVDDYRAARGITHDYDGPVLAEGLWSVVAVPVHVARSPRAVMYAAHRERVPLGERAKAVLMAMARTLADELAVRDEVDRRLAMVEAAATAVRADLRDVAQLEQVRAVHSELRAIAQALPDPELRDRLRAACRRLASLGATGPAPAVRLSARETDVLAQVALGCSNAETGRRLGLEPETVKSYLRSAMRKLDAHTRHEAVVRARTLGLLP
ncbi:MAG TPA: LuxR C-terminal-related transcriptional regulator [Pseudonocardiaceae bacterium]